MCAKFAKFYTNPKILYYLSFTYSCLFRGYLALITLFFPYGRLEGKFLLESHIVRWNSIQCVSAKYFVPFTIYSFSKITLKNRYKFRLYNIKLKIIIYLWLLSSSILGWLVPSITVAKIFYQLPTLHSTGDKIIPSILFNICIWNWVYWSREV